jgi:hypothetical protein
MSIGIMLRSGPARSLSRSTLRLVTSSGGRTTISFACRDARSKSAVYLVSSRQPGDLSLTVHKPFSTALQRYATTSGTPFDHTDQKHEKAVAKTEIEPHPEEVSTVSSVHQVFQEKGVEEPEKDEDMLAGVWEDLVSNPPISSFQKTARALIVRYSEDHQRNVCPS